jgi:hypothetical protein
MPSPPDPGTTHQKGARAHAQDTIDVATVQPCAHQVGLRLWFQTMKRARRHKEEASRGVEAQLRTSLRRTIRSAPGAKRALPRVYDLSTGARLLGVV